MSAFSIAARSSVVPSPMAPNERSVKFLDDAAVAPICRMRNRQPIDKSLRFFIYCRGGLRNEFSGRSAKSYGSDALIAYLDTSLVNGTKRSKNREVYSQTSRDSLTLTTSFLMM